MLFFAGIHFQSIAQTKPSIYQARVLYPSGVLDNIPVEVNGVSFEPTSTDGSFTFKADSRLLNVEVRLGQGEYDIVNYEGGKVPLPQNTSEVIYLYLGKSTGELLKKEIAQQLYQRERALEEIMRAYDQSLSTEIYSTDSLRKEYARLSGLREEEIKQELENTDHQLTLYDQLSSALLNYFTRAKDFKDFFYYKVAILILYNQKYEQMYAQYWNALEDSHREIEAIRNSTLPAMANYWDNSEVSYFKNTILNQQISDIEALIQKLKDSYQVLKKQRPRGAMLEGLEEKMVREAKELLKEIDLAEEKVLRGLAELKK